MIAIGGWLGGAWEWFMRSPFAQGCAFLLALLFAWNVTKDKLKAEGAREQARLNDAAAAKVKAAVNERKSEIIEEEQTNATEALAARDGGVHYPTASELPDELASLGFRNRGGGPAS